MKQPIHKGIEKKEKVVKHRHKWEVDYVECPVCGIGQVYICSCGEMRDHNKKPF